MNKIRIFSYEEFHYNVAEVCIEELSEPTKKVFEACCIPAQFNNGIHDVVYLIDSEDGRYSLQELIESASDIDGVTVITDAQVVDPNCREGLLVGTYEELLCAIDDGADDDILEILATSYDYFIVEDNGNHSEECEKIRELGKKMQKPVLCIIEKD